MRQAGSERCTSAKIFYVSFCTSIGASRRLCDAWQRVCLEARHAASPISPLTKIGRLPQSPANPSPLPKMNLSPGDTGCRSSRYRHKQLTRHLEAVSYVCRISAVICRGANGALGKGEEMCRWISPACYLGWTFKSVPEQCLFFVASSGGPSITCGSHPACAPWCVVRRSSQNPSL